MCSSSLVRSSDPAHICLPYCHFIGLLGKPLPHHSPPRPICLSCSAQQLQSPYPLRAARPRVKPRQSHCNQCTPVPPRKSGERQAQKQAIAILHHRKPGTQTMQRSVSCFLTQCFLDLRPQWVGRLPSSRWHLLFLLLYRCPL